MGLDGAHAPQILLDSGCLLHSRCGKAPLRAVLQALCNGGDGERQGQSNEEGEAHAPVEQAERPRRDERHDTGADGLGEQVRHARLNEREVVHHRRSDAASTLSLEFS